MSSIETVTPGKSVLRYPDFLCIGAQKAGTTWLDGNLRNHPALWLPPMKELQFFSHLHDPRTRRWTTRQRSQRGTQLLVRYIRKTPYKKWDYRLIARLADIVAGPINDDWYGRIFALAAANQICGEITPDYSTLPPEGIAHILRLSPHVRVVLSMRDPIERSWSHIRMLARTRGVEDPATLEDFASSADHLDRADYPAIIANWQRFVPAERFLNIFFDDIESSPNRVLEQVCNFLNVEYKDEFFTKAANPVHVGEELQMPPSVSAILKERLKPVYDSIAQLYPEIGAAWMKRHY